MEIIGYAAGTLTTIAFIPQVYRIYKNKSAEDISYGMYCIFSLGVVLWMTYGIQKDANAVILANGFTLFLVMVILGLKRKYDRNHTNAK